MSLRLLFDKISAPAIWRIHICYLLAGWSVLGKTVAEVLRPKAQFFPIRTNLSRQITCLLFSSVEYFVSSFCVEFSLQPFSNLVYDGCCYLNP